MAKLTYRTILSGEKIQLAIRRKNDLFVLFCRYKDEFLLLAAFGRCYLILQNRYTSQIFEVNGTDLHDAISRKEFVLPNI